MVILAHEGEVEDVLDIYPGELRSWKEKGWKVAKERRVKEAERKRIKSRKQMVPA